MTLLTPVSSPIRGNDPASTNASLLDKELTVSSLATMSVVNAPNGQNAVPGQQCPSPSAVQSSTLTPALHVDHVLQVTVPC